MWGALDLLGTLREYETALLEEEGLDPTLPLPEHAAGTAEACRAAFPDLDWLHLVGLLHSLGKLLAHKRCGARRPLGRTPRTPAVPGGWAGRRTLRRVSPIFACCPAVPSVCALRAWGECCQRMHQTCGGTCWTSAVCRPGARVGAPQSLPHNPPAAGRPARPPHPPRRRAQVWRRAAVGGVRGELPGWLSLRARGGLPAVLQRQPRPPPPAVQQRGRHVPPRLRPGGRLHVLERGRVPLHGARAPGRRALSNEEVLGTCRSARLLEPWSSQWSVERGCLGPPGEYVKGADSLPSQRMPVWRGCHRWCDWGREISAVWTGRSCGQPAQAPS